MWHRTTLIDPLSLLSVPHTVQFAEKAWRSVNGLRSVLVKRNRLVEYARAGLSVETNWTSRLS